MKKTILWALSSKCGFHCKYCYLNFPEDRNPINNINNKDSEDLTEEEMIEFISKLKENDIERIFIAGAEPLSNPTKTFKIIEEMKKYDLQVVLCTNGYTLSENYKEIIKCKIDAISISLDSYDKKYNDKYRQYPNNNGWEKVVDGIELLREERKKQKSNIKIGIYTVLTKINMKDLDVTYQFVSKLGLDYFVFQPIYLDKNNELFEELTLDKTNIKELKKMIKKTYYEETSIKLPNKQYIELLVKSIEGSIETIKNCFAGENLFFITPDGGIYPCPSSNCIVNEKEKLTIKDNYDINKLQKFAKKHGILIIEDACQAFGSKWDNKFLGTYGTFGCFSMKNGKILATGEGGFILTNNDKLADRCRLLRNHCTNIQDTTKSFMEISWNYRITEMQALIGIINLKDIENKINIRREQTKYLYDNLRNENQLEIYKYYNKEESNYFSPVFIAKGNKRGIQIAKELSDNGIINSTGTFGLMSANKRQVFQNYCNGLVENDKMNTPNSEQLFQDVIALSIMENTSIDKLDKIIKSIKNIL